MHESLYNDARSAIGDGDELERAYNYFIASWLGRNGTSGLPDNKTGKAFCVRYTKNGGHGATRFIGCVDSIPAWRRRLRCVTILNRDAFEVIDRIEDAAGVVIYADPPYLTKAARYLHDFDSWDHYKLAKALSRFKKTRVVISYYEHPRLEELYPGWTKLSIEVSKSMAAQSKRDDANDVRAVEALLINGPSFTTEAA